MFRFKLTATTLKSEAYFIFLTLTLFTCNWRFETLGKENTLTHLKQGLYNSYLDGCHQSPLVFTKESLYVICIYGSFERNAFLLHFSLIPQTCCKIITCFLLYEKMRILEYMAVTGEVNLGSQGQDQGFIQMGILGRLFAKTRSWRQQNLWMSR